MYLARKGYHLGRRALSGARVGSICMEVVCKESLYTLYATCVATNGVPLSSGGARITGAAGGKASERKWM
jgi:hypothetical protein